MLYVFFNVNSRWVKSIIKRWLNCCEALEGKMMHTWPRGVWGNLALKTRLRISDRFLCSSAHFKNASYFDLENQSKTDFILINLWLVDKPRSHTSTWWLSDLCCCRGFGLQVHRKEEISSAAAFSWRVLVHRVHVWPNLTKSTVTSHHSQWRNRTYITVPPASSTALWGH